MTDLMKIVEDRRARLAAEQAKIDAELAKLDEFARMAAILSESKEALNEEEETANAVFRVRILGLSAGGRAHGDGAGARSSEVVKERRSTGEESDQSGSARTTTRPQPTTSSAMQTDSFVFADQSPTGRDK